MWEGLPAHGDGLSSARCLQPKMCLPNFVFAAEFRLQGRTSHLQRSIPEPRTLSNSVFGPNFVFRTNFVFTNEFRLQRAPNRISSSQEFRLHGRFSSSHFVFAHNLSFSSLRTISSSKASEFRLQGGTKPGPTFPGQCSNTRTKKNTREMLK